MKYLISNTPLIIDIAKHTEAQKRRIAIRVIRQNTPTGLVAQLSLKAIANAEDIALMNANGYSLESDSLVLLNGGQEITTFIPLIKELTTAQVDAFYAGIEFPEEITTRSQKDEYFELVIAGHFIELDSLFGGLKQTDFSILNIN